jgi:hypothetical protein
MYGLEIKPSTIPNAGKGLFAYKDFKKNEFVAPYDGELIDKAEVEKRYGRGKFVAPYTIHVSGDKYLDAALVRGVAAYANHKNKAQSNTRFSVHRSNKTVNIKSTKAIKKGQEIFVSYGKDSSKFIKGMQGVHYKTRPFKYRSLIRGASLVDYRID